MNRRQAGALGLLLGGALFLTGCTPSAPGSHPSPDKSQVTNSSSEVPVTRADVTPVSTFNATVATGVSFEVTAPVTGLFNVDQNGDLVVTGSNGNPKEIVLSSFAENITMLVPRKTIVPKGLPIARATYSGFVLQATIEGIDLLKLKSNPESAKAQVSGSSAPFECHLLDPVPTSNQQAAQNPTGSSLYCIIPNDVPVINGLKGVLAIRFPTIKNALVLPVEAVAGSLESGSVNVKNGGVLVEKPVTLGPSNGAMIVIESGLKEGDKVLMPSPSLING